MRILTVASPHAVATRDVYVGHLRGLQAVLGKENVVSFDIIKRFNLFTHFTAWLEENILKTEETGNKIPRAFAANILAAEPVFGAAHAHQVDAVYFISPMYFPMSIVEMLRADGFKVWAYFTECPYEDEYWARVQAPKFDVCFVSDRNSVARFKMFNERTYYLPHAYDPSVHYPRKWTEKAANASIGAPNAPIIFPPPPNDHRHVMFVGTGFPSRQRFLEEVDWSDIDIRLWGNWWEVGDDSPIAPYVRRRLVENHTTAALYRGSSVGISMHRSERFYRTGGRIDDGEAYSIGPRAYELAACGLMQISDPRPELQDVFRGTIPTFETPDDLERTLRYFLANDVWREDLARQQMEAVQGHTVEARMRQLLAAAA